MRKKRAITLVIVIVIAAPITLRLIANKRSLDAALKEGTEFNTIIPVLVDRVKEEPITTELRINGSFSPSYEVSVASETQGSITSIFAETGDKVAANQQLALVDTVLTAAQYEQAKSNFEKAEKDLKRFDLLFKDNAVSLEQYESVKLAFVNAKAAQITARKRYENSVIRAPVSGIITKRHIEKGTYLTAGTPAFDIIKINKMKFIAKLTSDEIIKVKKGQKVRITADLYPGVLYEGIVTAVGISADSSKQYDVEVQVNNRNDKLIRPGMYGAALFGGQSSGQWLVIPRKALTGSIKAPEVFVIKGDSVVLQSITAVPINDKYLGVKQGLNIDDIVVVSGQINLKEGSKIKIIQ